MITAKAHRLIEHHPGVRKYRHVAWTIVGKSRFYGLNSAKTHPDCVREHDGVEFSSTHAEQKAIISTPYLLRDGAKLHVARVHTSGRLQNSKPCEECMVSMRAAGIVQVSWSCDDGTWQSEEM